MASPDVADCGIIEDVDPRELADRWGPLLPDHAAEDDPAAWGDQPDDAEARLRAEVPPHHGT